MAHGSWLMAHLPLLTGWTLANKFPLSAGTVSFTVPASLATRDDYIVVLFGDSGNASPHFKINGASSQKKHSH